MAIVKMNKVFLAGMVSDRMRILDTLMSAGVVQIDELDEGAVAENCRALVARTQPTEELNRLDVSLYRVKSALAVLERYAPVKKPLFAKQRAVSRDAYRTLDAELDGLLHAADEIAGIKERIDAAVAQKNHLEHKMEQLARFETLDIPLERSETLCTRIVYGTIPAAFELDELHAALDKLAVCLWELGADEDNHYIGLIGYVDDWRDALAVLDANAFSALRTDGLSGTPRANVERWEKEQRGLDEQIASLEQAARDMAGKREALETCYDYLTDTRDKHDAAARFLHTETVFMATGWAPADACGALRQRLEDTYDSIVVEITQPEPGEDTPILLQNNSFVHPFELVTELYSLPRAREVDPDPVMSIFYFVFFGLMLSDAGYGIVLTLLTGLMVWRYKPEGILGKLVRLLLFGGISTTVWGVLFGGWFGDALGLAPVWFNPLDDPMTLLVWSFVFGAIHLFAGMGIRAYLLIREGRWLDAVFDIGFWYAVLIGLALLLVNTTVGAVVAGIGAVGLVLTQGRHKKNIFQKILSGIGSLYDITSYLSDILSYSRLLALGLATGVIATVVNTMCRLAGGNVFALTLAAVGFVAGHVFNLAINTLGAYVHASRLQYVEFFGKFYEGGGEPFRPLRRRPKYVDLK